MDFKVRTLDWLKQHTQDAHRALSQFTGGGFLFVSGIMIILLADRMIPDGIKQEMIALFGLVLVILGAILALWGYMSISIFRVLTILLERPNNDDKRK